VSGPFERRYQQVGTVTATAPAALDDVDVNSPGSENE